MSDGTKINGKNHTGNGILHPRNCHSHMLNNVVKHEKQTVIAVSARDRRFGFSVSVYSMCSRE